MRQHLSLPLAAAAVATGLAAASVHGQAVIDGGHWDLNAVYADGDWDLNWFDLSNAAALAVETTTVIGVFDSTATGFLAGIDAPTPRPGGAAWNFTGAAAGDDLFIFPQSDSQPELPYLGIAGYGIERDVFVDNAVTLTFEGLVSGPSGGDFSLYQFVGGSPRGLASSSDASLTFADNTLPINRGRHQHYNWAFTEVGTYELAFSLGGTLAADDSVVESDTFVATFTVVPEPAGLSLLGLGGVALLRRRR